MMLTIFGIAVMVGLVLPAHAESVRSNQKDYGNQSTTVTSNAHGAPPKVVPPPAPSSVNPVVIVSPPVNSTPAPAGRRP
jgi:hypothetical protein